MLFAWYGLYLVVLILIPQSSWKSPNPSSWAFVKKPGFNPGKKPKTHRVGFLRTQTFSTLIKGTKGATQYTLVVDDGDFKN